MIRATLRRTAPLFLIIILLLATSCLSWSNLWRESQAHVVARDIAYVDGTTDDKQRLDVWAPIDARDAPVVVFVHGGYWRSGDRRYFEPIIGLYGNIGVALGDLGVVTVLPSYRLFPQVRSIEPMLDDVAAAIRWTRDHIASYGGDPARIVLAGHSAGGHLVLQLVTAPDALTSRGIPAGTVRGVAPISGIFDIVAATKAAKPDLRSELWEPLFGKDPEGWSPLRRLTPELARATPMLFFVGGRDYDTCRSDFSAAQEALRDVDAAHALFVTAAVFDHAEMVLRIGTNKDVVMPAVAAFAHAVTTTTTTTTASAPPVP